MAAVISMSHRSPVHDGFATIRSTRSTRSKNKIQPDSSSGLGGEYFTIRRNNKQSFLDNNNIAKYIVKPEDVAFVNEPIYAKITPPSSTETSPTKPNKGEGHYDSIDIKPRRNSKKRRPKDVTEAIVSPLPPELQEEDVLKDLPDKFIRSPQKYATLNSRRPKSIDIQPAFDNPNYGTTSRIRMGYNSEPTTPLDYTGPPAIELKHFPNGYLKKNGVRRSNSEVGFSRLSNGGILPSFRHSVSVDVSSPSTAKNHVCCECVTKIGMGYPSSRTSGFNRTLDTLYESQDPKVGCQTILRSKPPVPWWDLAIRKSRYQSCPILDEVRCYLLHIYYEIGHCIVLGLVTLVI